MMAGPAKHKPVKKNSGIHNIACQWEIAPSREATSKIAELLNNPLVAHHSISPATMSSTSRGVARKI